jgi:hypothetical protein
MERFQEVLVAERSQKALASERSQETWDMQRSHEALVIERSTERSLVMECFQETPAIGPTAHPASATSIGALLLPQSAPGTAARTDSWLPPGTSPLPVLVPP